MTHKALRVVTSVSSFSRSSWTLLPATKTVVWLKSPEKVRTNSVEFDWFILLLFGSHNFFNDVEYKVWFLLIILWYLRRVGLDLYPVDSQLQLAEMLKFGFSEKWTTLTSAWLNVLNEKSVRWLMIFFEIGYVTIVFQASSCINDHQNYCYQPLYTDMLVIFSKPLFLSPTDEFQVLCFYEQLTHDECGQLKRQSCYFDLTRSVVYDNGKLESIKIIFNISIFFRQTSNKIQ